MTTNLPKPDSKIEQYQRYLAGEGLLSELPKPKLKSEKFLYGQCVNRDNNTNNELVLSSRIKDFSRYNVKEHESYDQHNVQISINDIVSKMIAGDELLLPWGSYDFTSTLNFINLKEGCRIILNGTLNAVGSFSPAMRISGNGFKVSLNKMLSNIVPLTDYSNIVNDGLVLGDKGCSNCQIDVNIIEGFLTGITPCPDNGNGVQYVKVTYNWLRNCKTGILLTCGATGLNWVNENTFTGGKTSGYNGLKMLKGAGQNDPFNNNKFYNVGFETLKGYAVTLNFAIANSFFNTRMCEAIAGMYIVDDATCKQNLFIISHLLPLDKLNLVGTFTRVIAPINNTIADTWLYSGFIINWLGAKKFDLIEAGSQTFSNVNGTIRPDVKQAYIATDTQAVVVTLSKDAEYAGNEIIIKDTWHVNTITINKWDGTTAIAAGVIDCYGRWILRRGSTAWEAYLLPYKMDLQAPSTAVDVVTLKNDFNSLISKLKAMGLMKIV